ncbi:unnamed protein product [Symbiodinium sp. CCMP2592]|nr:unnamed protein product [Symbiodinium sp. CCMP2592]
MTPAGAGGGEAKFLSSETTSRPQTAWGAPDGGLLRLAHLSHAVVAPGVEERLRIELRDIVLPPPGGGPGGPGHPPNGAVYDELRCKAYVGPARALFGSDGRPDKSRLKEARLEVSGHQAAAEVDLGVPEPQEPWALRMKLYRRPASNLFAQEKCAEFVEALPCPRSAVQLPGPSSCGVPGGGRQVGQAQVEEQFDFRALAPDEQKHPWPTTSFFADREADFGCDDLCQPVSAPPAYEFNHAVSVSTTIGGYATEQPRSPDPTGRTSAEVLAFQVLSRGNIQYEHTEVEREQQSVEEPENEQLDPTGGIQEPMAEDTAVEADVEAEATEGSALLLGLTRATSTAWNSVPGEKEYEALRVFFSDRVEDDKKVLQWRKRRKNFTSKKQKEKHGKILTYHKCPEDVQKEPDKSRAKEWAKWQDFSAAIILDDAQYGELIREGHQVIPIPSG